jgi:hypothetical protein
MNKLVRMANGRVAVLTKLVMRGVRRKVVVISPSSSVGRAPDS